MALHPGCLWKGEPHEGGSITHHPSLIAHNKSWSRPGGGPDLIGKESPDFTGHGAQQGIRDVLVATTKLGSRAIENGKCHRNIPPEAGVGRQAMGIGG